MCSTLFGASLGKVVNSNVPLSVSTTITGAASAAAFAVVRGPAAFAAACPPGGAVWGLFAAGADCATSASAAPMHTTTIINIATFRRLITGILLNHTNSWAMPRDGAIVAARTNRAADILSPGHQVEVHQRPPALIR